MNTRQKGLTLTELLISMALASIISLGLSVIYLESRKQQQQELAVLEVYENGQLALDILQHELRMAGFAVQKTPVLAQHLSCEDARLWLMDFSRGVDVQANANQSVYGVPMNHVCLSVKPVAGSDVLWIHRLAEQPLLEAQTLPQAWYVMQSYDASGKPEQSRLMYLSEWPDEIEAGAELWPLQSRIYYVRDYSVAGDSIPALVMVTPAADGFQHQVLIEGVEQLQLEWLIRLPDQTMQAVRTPTAQQLDNTVLARIYLLVRHRLPLADALAEKHYRLAGDAFHQPHDSRYIRQVFSSSVMLRNHGAGL